MRIAIDLLIAEKEPGGMLFAAQALLEGLIDIGSDHEYVLITAQPQAYQALLARARTTTIRIYPVRLYSRRALLIQHQLWLPDILRQIRPDLLHVPTFVAPIGWHGPLVITVHDLAFLYAEQSMPLHIRLYWQHLLHESARRAQCVIAVSEKTRAELIRYWSIEDKRIVLVPNALRSTLSRVHITTEQMALLRQQYGQRYLLHVGRIVPHKNVEMLVAAFQLLAAQYPDVHLVLVGGYAPGAESVRNLIASSPYRERIHQVGWATEHYLSMLYTAAHMLVFPSLHEGFGLPTLEAMVFGLPVIVNVEAISQEVGGDAPLRVDCRQPAKLAEAIMQVLTDTPLRERLIQLGQQHVQRYSREECARATCAVYHHAVHNGGVTTMAGACL